MRLLHLSLALVLLSFLSLGSSFRGGNSRFGANPSINVSNITLAPPKYVPQHAYGALGQLIAIKNNVYLSVAFDEQYVQSYLYQFDYHLNLTGTLNLTSVDQYAFVGFSLFGVAQTDSIYAISNHNIALINASNPNSLKVELVIEINDGALDHGFPSTDGTEIWVFFNNFTNYATGFLAFDAVTLQTKGFFTYLPPPGYTWDYTPECQSSPNNYTAYCQFGIRNSHGSVEQYIEEFSLSNFAVQAKTNLADWMDVAYIGYQGKCEVWSVYQWYFDGHVSFNISGFSSSLQALWNTTLPSNTIGVDGIVIVADSVLVSLTIQQSRNVLAGQIYQYSSETGTLMQRYPNSLPYVVKFNYDSVPNPYILYNLDQNLYSVGLATAAGDPNYLVRWEF